MTEPTPDWLKDYEESQAQHDKKPFVRPKITQNPQDQTVDEWLKDYDSVERL